MRVAFQADMKKSSDKIRVGIDTGGTFTDFSCLDAAGRWRVWKTLSTPDDPSQAIMEGLSSFMPDISPGSIELVHGTTVGTNAFIERKGARTMLITTAGFEDVFFIGRQARPELYALKQRRPAQVLSVDMVIGVRERMDSRGNVIIPLDEREIRRIESICLEKQPESIAICLLHSYTNPVHEQMLADVLAGTGIPLSVSSLVMPEFREYERTSTTVINAYLGPVVGDYIERLENRLPETSIFVQYSNGGCAPASLAGRQAVNTLLSGPAGGVQAALELGMRTGFENIITFDMGGTSTDVSLCPGELTYTRDYRIEGFPVAIPFIDIHTVGAGGGSVAWIDRGGLMQVGPESAGADPGPVCYGRGDRVTVTDANLFLGRLRADMFLAGRMRLWPERTAEAMERLAERLGMNSVETALGVIRLVNVNMVQAIRAVSVERGYDPRDFALVSFGGAAGMHALEVAGELGIGTVIIPDNAGIFSAAGMSGSELTFEKSSAFIRVMRERADERLLEDAFLNLERKVMAEVSGYGIETGDVVVRRRVDARYAGQSFELSVEWSDAWRDAFHMAHRRLYGYDMPQADVEVTAIRIGVIAGKTKSRGVAAEEGPASFCECREIAQTEIVFSGDEKVTVPLYDRKDVVASGGISGPCMIVDDFTTVVVSKGWGITVRDRHMICRRGDAAVNR
jgi:N-methylhydantoinase A